MAAAFKNYIQKSFLITCLNRQQVRFYPRWSHRRPVRVYSPDEYQALRKPQEVMVNKTIANSCEITEGVEKTNNKTEEQQESLQVVDLGYERIKPPRTLNLRKPTHKKEIAKVDMFETVMDDDGNFIYTKMQNKDIRVTSLFVDLKSKKSKESMLLEGKRLIREALMSGCKLQYLLFSRKDDIEDLKDCLPKRGAKLYKMPYREMQAWSELTTTPGVIAIFKIPDLRKIERKSYAIPLTVICDNIREPGNLGAVLRISAGVGCQNIILAKGCTDLWNVKVLRSACGAHFKVPIENKLDWPEIRKKIQESVVFIADNNVNSTEETSTLPIFPYVDIDYKLCKHITLVIGGETEGISAESYKLAIELNGCRINIPLINDVESLNTGSAFSVIAFEIKRQLAEHNVDNVEESNLQ